MDFLTWENAGIAALFVLGLVTLVVVGRLFRSGLSTYGQSHSSMEKRIRQTEAEIRECNKSMPQSEQMAMLSAALNEVLDLAGKPEGFAVARQGRQLMLLSPEGEMRISHQVRSSALRGSKRVIHGTGQWQVEGGGQETQSFTDLAALMSHLGSVVRGENTAPEEEQLPQFRRRFS